MFEFLLPSQNYGEFWIAEVLLKFTCAFLMGYLGGLIIVRFLNALSGRANQGSAKRREYEEQSRVDLGKSILPDEYLQKKRAFRYGEEDDESQYRQ